MKYLLIIFLYFFTFNIYSQNVESKIYKGTYTYLNERWYAGEMFLIKNACTTHIYRTNKKVSKIYNYENDVFADYRFYIIKEIRIINDKYAIVFEYENQNYLMFIEDAVKGCDITTKY